MHTEEGLLVKQANLTRSHVACLLWCEALRAAGEVTVNMGQQSQVCPKFFLFGLLAAPPAPFIPHHEHAHALWPPGLHRCWVHPAPRVIKCWVHHPWVLAVNVSNVSTIMISPASRLRLAANRV